MTPRKERWGLLGVDCKSKRYCRSSWVYEGVKTCHSIFPLALPGTLTHFLGLV